VDPASGFGLLQPLADLAAAPIRRGSASGCHVGENVIVAGHGGRSHALKASVFARREFAGYWEYLLDEALFTVPAHPQWGGSALINRRGELIGIGSLLVQEKMDADTVQGNMFIPIDLLEPILGDLLARGGVDRPARPWIGLYAAEVDNRLAVAGTSSEGPAERAGVQVGDVIVEVAGRRVQGLADFLRALWSLGPAGVEVPLALTRDGRRVSVTMISVDRQQLLKRPPLH
jgi:S1-C subfamily serine protease